MFLKEGQIRGCKPYLSVEGDVVGCGGDSCVSIPLNIVLEGDAMPIMEMSLELENSPLVCGQHSYA